MNDLDWPRLSKACHMPYGKGFQNTPFPTPCLLLSLDILSCKETQTLDRLTQSAGTDRTCRSAVSSRRLHKCCLRERDISFPLPPFSFRRHMVHGPRSHLRILEWVLTLLARSVQPRFSTVEFFSLLFLCRRNTARIVCIENEGVLGN